MPNEAWRKAQIEGLIKAGVHPLDAEEAVREAMLLIPDGVDPQTHVPSPGEIQEPLDPEKHIRDANAAWYSSPTMPAWAKRILDAKLISPAEEKP